MEEKVHSYWNVKTAESCEKICSNSLSTYAEAFIHSNIITLMLAAVKKAINVSDCVKMTLQTLLRNVLFSVMFP